MNQGSFHARSSPPWGAGDPLELRAEGLIVGDEPLDSPTMSFVGPVIVRIREGVIEAITTGAGPGAPGYRRIDLDGCLLAPGFVDAHVHATSTGALLDGLDLRGCTSARQLLDEVGRACRNTPTDLHVGHGWDETSWPDAVPSVRDLNEAAQGARVYLSRIDVHSALVSSALRASVSGLTTLEGFDAEGPLTRQAHGAARRAAFGNHESAQRRRSQRAFRTAAAALGIVAVHEMAGPSISGSADLAELLALGQHEPGPVVRGYWGQLAVDGGISTAAQIGAIGVGGDLFIDGALGSRTACLRDPYESSGDDDTGSDRGALYIAAEDVAEHVVAATLAGVQAGFHVIGDAAADALCEGMARAERRLGLDALRARQHRVEHIEMLDERQRLLLARWHVSASVQPMFDALWGGDDGMYADRLGRRRAGTLNPFAAMESAGIRLAFGSDSPVTHLGPWSAVAAAMGHHQPTQRLGARSAFAAHTRHGWAAAGEDAGRVAVGQPAHLAVWRSDATTLDDLIVDAPTCVMTIVHGTIAHQAMP